MDAAFLETIINVFTNGSIIEKIVLGISLFVTIMSVVVKLTPTKTDNEWFAGFLKVIEKLSLNNTPVNSTNDTLSNVSKSNESGSARLKFIFVLLLCSSFFLIGCFENLRLDSPEKKYLVASEQLNDFMEEYIKYKSLFSEGQQQKAREMFYYAAEVMTLWKSALDSKGDVNSQVRLWLNVKNQIIAFLAERINTSGRKDINYDKQLDRHCGKTYNDYTRCIGKIERRSYAEYRCIN